MSFRESEFIEVAAGLGYPESPVPLSDGGFLVVDLKTEALVRYRPSADGSFVADAPITLSDPEGKLQSGPNGAAVGPDGHIYICNNGGKQINTYPQQDAEKRWQLNVTGDAAVGYAGGYIQRVNLDTGKTEVWCGPASPATGATDAASQAMPLLSSPDDLIFDADGGFWFTDWGNSKGRSRETTGVYYVPRGSQTPIEKVPLRSAPNGIGISPAGDRLYVAETYNRWVVYFVLTGPGQIAPNPLTWDGSYLLTAHLPGSGLGDSLRLDQDGNIYLATLLPHGLNPHSNGGITVISPAGEVLEFLELNVGVPEPLPSSLCFGGLDRRTAFITCGGTGRVLSCRMRIPGHPAAFTL